MPQQRSTYRILSIDAGGVRGLLSAVWLQRLGGRLWKHFDLIAGTSTGSACAISNGLPASKMADLVQHHAREFFPGSTTRFWQGLRDFLSHISTNPKCDGQGLEAVLRAIFKGTRFGGSKAKPTLVTAYDAFSRKPVIFKNTRTRFHDLPVWQVCKRLVPRRPTSRLRRVGRRCGNAADRRRCGCG